MLSGMCSATGFLHPQEAAPADGPHGRASDLIGEACIICLRPAAASMNRGPEKARAASGPGVQFAGESDDMFPGASKSAMQSAHRMNMRLECVMSYISLPAYPCG